jgi:hypothetical protein
MEFRVIWEVDIDADSPKQAIEKARAVQLEPDMPATVFDVWDYAKQRMQRIDLAAQPDRLDGVEMASVRASLRLLQCAPGLPRETKDIAAAMLIFLDSEERCSRRHGP